MTAAHQTLAVLFPGADKMHIAVASAKYSIEIEGHELYSEQKDYEKYFRPSWHIFHNEDVSLLFVYPDGSAQLIEDATNLKKALNRMHVPMEGQIAG